MKTATLYALLLASTLVAPSCQSTQVEQGRGKEGAIGTSNDVYAEQRHRVYLAEIEEAIRNGRTESARRLLAQMPAARKELTTMRLLAESFIADGDLDAARRTLVEAAALPGGDVGLARLTAVIEELAGNWEEAGAAYLRAADEEPGDATLLVGHARTLLAAGDLVAAANFLERQSAVHPDSFELAAAAADACMALGRHREAVSHYTRASVLRPNDARIAQGTVLAFALGGYHAAALSRAEHLPMDQADPVLRLALGRSALLEGRPEQAIEQIGRYLDVAESDGAAWLDLARANYLLGRQDAALSALQQALTHSRPSAPALMLLGHVRSRAGQYDLALASYRKAIDLGGERKLLDPLVAAMERRVADAEQAGGPLSFVEE